MSGWDKGRAYCPLEETGILQSTLRPHPSAMAQEGSLRDGHGTYGTYSLASTSENRPQVVPRNRLPTPYSDSIPSRTTALQWRRAGSLPLDGFSMEEWMSLRFPVF